MIEKPTVDIYKSGVDGKWVVHIDTNGGDNPSDEIRVYINDDIENPAFGDALITAIN